MQIVKIPQERISVILGKGGETKDYLEQRMKVSLSVDSDGAVQMDGEPIDEFIAKDMVKAIGRGFDPAVALKLLSDEYGFRLIDLRDHADSEKHRHRIAGRIIGEKGRTREIIEEEIGANVIVYGHTVGVICRLETLDYATTAIFKLIEGANHATVYGYLEKCRRKIKEAEIGKML